ncbi:MAG: tRNA lysidine(34) synthetase TilS [Bacteroidota bacterium]|nr:tRNA lysidine(34) synthetase TilS [Bacteroidota bacterium]
MNLLNEFKQYIQEEELFESHNQLLVTVSGGVDSMVLLHLLVETGAKIQVAHANFNLRGAESEADEELVTRFCTEKNIHLHSKKFDTHKYMLSSGLGLQEAARNLRYSWFNQLLQENKLDYILTAHHANDQAETLVFNLIRGTAVNGLAGIKNKHENKRRPLLFATKAQLTEYAYEHHIVFRNDLSNSKDMYSRNYIRLHVIPHLLKINPAFVKQTLHFSRLMQATSHYYHIGINDSRNYLLKSTDEKTGIDLNKLCTEPYPEQLLYEFIHPFGFNFIQCTQILKAWKQNKTGAVFLTQSHRALLNRKELLLEPKLFEKVFHVINEFPFALTYQNRVMRFTLQPYSNSFCFEPGLFYLNADELVYPLTIRSIETGDRFVPLGMQHSRKISDYLTDKKVDRFSKEKALVLVQKEKMIAALLPYQISDLVKVKDTCKMVLVIEVEHGE